MKMACVIHCLAQEPVDNLDQQQPKFCRKNYFAILTAGQFSI